MNCTCAEISLFYIDAGDKCHQTCFMNQPLILTIVSYNYSEFFLIISSIPISINKNVNISNVILLASKSFVNLSFVVLSMTFGHSQQKMLLYYQSTSMELLQLAANMPIFDAKLAIHFCRCHLGIFQLLKTLISTRC